MEVTMHHSRIALLLPFALAAMLSAGCTGLQGRQPIDVIVAGVEPLKGAGLELRLLIKLRVQNPNDTPIDFTGVSLRMDVQGKRFATGVSNTAGSVPRFGESIVEVPVSISLLRIARQAVGVMSSEYHGKLAYDMTGHLAGTAFRSVRFRSTGELTLPAEVVDREVTE
jgi:LEA14-like dessication related protein